MCSVWWPCWPVQYIRVTKSYTNRPIIASKLTGNIKPTSEPAQHLGVQTKLLIVLNWEFSLETNLLILFLYRLYLVQYTFSFESNFQLLCASATIAHSAAIGALSPHTRCYLKTLASIALFCSAPERLSVDKAGGCYSIYLSVRKDKFACKSSGLWILTMVQWTVWSTVL